MPEPGPRRAPWRPISRAIVGTALVALGAVAASRLPLAYQPTWSFPELQVELWLPEVEPLDVATRRYLEPVEGAIRAVSGVRDMVGRVNGFGGRFRVRFAPGADVEKKAARLDSELEALRRRLPEGASLTVLPSGQTGGDQSTLVLLPGETGTTDPRLVEALRALPEVREVEVAGERRIEVRVTANDPRQDLDSLRRAAGDGRRVLGEVGAENGSGRRVDLLTVPWAETLGERPVRRGGRAVPLAAVASVDLRRDEPHWQARSGGRSGQVLIFSRHLEASPLDLVRSVRRTLEAFGRGDAEFLVDEAGPLVILLRRLAWGAVLGALLLGLTGLRVFGLAGLAQAAVPVLALAAALNALWLAGLGDSEGTLDVTTLPPLAVALAAALAVHGLRGAGSRAGAWAWVWTAMAAVAVPVAVVLAGGPMGALLASPARLFAVALPAASAAVFLVPAPRGVLGDRSLALLRWLWRRPWAVLLATGAAAYALVVVFGEALLPRPGRLSPAVADLVVNLSFVEGTSASEAAALVARAEEVIGERPEVTKRWSVFNPRRGATLGVEVVAEERSLPRLSAFASRLELQLQSLGASAQATPLAGVGGGEPLSFDDALIPGPEIDEGISTYRFLLKSPDAPALLEALERIEEMRRGYSWLTDKVVVSPEWGPPAEQWLLVPRPGADRELVRNAVALVAERAGLPPASPTVGLPGDPRPVLTRVTGAGAPTDPADPPELGDVLGAQLEARGVSAPGELFELREVLGSPTLLRQRGSFVLPVEMRIRNVTRGERPYVSNTIHARLSALGWPAGVDRELPPLERRHLTPEKLRLYAVASALPFLLFCLAVCRLDSWPLALAASMPAAVAVASVTPLLASTRGGADELTLLALAATLAAVWALSAEVASALKVERPSRLAVAPGYRWLARRLPQGAGVTLAWLAILLVPTLALPSDRYAWVTALRVASLAGVAGLGAAFLVLPVLLRTVDRLRFHDREAARRAASPPAWRDEGRMELAVRNLSKVYGNGFRALERVGFTLEPGIVGLLGPNGAGKTTLLRCLCGLLEPTRGQVLFRGVPVEARNLPSYRRRVGFLPQSFNAYEGFTVEAFLDFWALERGILDPRDRQRELEEVLAQVDLAEVAGRKVRDLSGGMRRRIGIARALLGAPPVLIVDEPTTGLDVESRNRLRESLLQAAGERIILFSTHIASDVAAAASRILVLDRGRLVFDGPAGGLIDEAHGRVFEQLLDDAELREFSSRYRVTTRVRTLGGIRVRAVASAEQEPAGTLVRPNLEEAYLAKLGQGPRAPGGGRRTGSLLDLGLA